MKPVRRSECGQCWLLKSFGAMAEGMEGVSDEMDVRNGAALVCLVLFALGWRLVRLRSRLRSAAVTKILCLLYSLP